MFKGHDSGRKIRHGGCRPLKTIDYDLRWKRGHIDPSGTRESTVTVRVYRDTSIGVSKGCCPGYRVFRDRNERKREWNHSPRTAWLYRDIVPFDEARNRYTRLESWNVTKERNNTFHDGSSTKSGERLLRPGLFHDHDSLAHRLALLRA